MRLDDIMLLDRVQKGLRISAEAVKHLRSEGLVEGRVPHLHVSAKIAALTGGEVDYIKNRQKPSKFYHSLILDYLEKFKEAPREKIDELLLDEIRGPLSIEKKKGKISNILTYMRRKGYIYNSGSDTASCWKLSDKAENQNVSQRGVRERSKS